MLAHGRLRTEFVSELVLHPMCSAVEGSAHRIEHVVDITFLDDQRWTETECVTTNSAADQAFFLREGGRFGANAFGWLEALSG